ncbi:hypothetical protein GQ607_017160 [Colletotrichum asianum]|uniref:C2H2-type domain-containing protein n=1 Tax=Colletotrichum asianum TaxID=702518 RepID=A0A8H3VZP1_9PEZI|nr:hypothetical protein GQ607_017160 [Colletotrichum asianum]
MPSTINPDLNDFNTILRPHSTSCSVTELNSPSHVKITCDSDSVTGANYIPDTTSSALPANTYQHSEIVAADADTRCHNAEEGKTASLIANNLPSLAEGPPTSTSPLTCASAGCTPITPEAEDCASTRLDSNKSDKKKYVCAMGCSKSFLSPKDLRRHHNSDAHAQTDGQSYQCRCDYSTRRRDHYRRHLRQNMGNKQCRSKQAYFHCICKHFTPESNLLQHLQHIATCATGRGISGRPRRT